MVFAAIGAIIRLHGGACCAGGVYRARVGHRGRHTSARAHNRHIAGRSVLQHGKKKHAQSNEAPAHGGSLARGAASNERLELERGTGRVQGRACGHAMSGIRAPGGMSIGIADTYSSSVQSDGDAAALIHRA
jgi:hypothetical protein